MYEVPNRENVKKVIVKKECITDKAKPTIILNDKEKGTAEIA
jgi:ATP-dependent protease Clp ATPase subunit